MCSFDAPVQYQGRCVPERAFGKPFFRIFGDAFCTNDRGYVNGVLNEIIQEPSTSWRGQRYQAVHDHFADAGYFQLADYALNEDEGWVQFTNVQVGPAYFKPSDGGCEVLQTRYYLGTTTPVANPLAEATIQID
jgi:hypothetical protein